jgi:galactosamine-6-phosphate isomerase
MTIKILDTKKDMSWQASNLIIRELEKNKNMLMCAATGSTPTETYKLLAEASQNRPQLFSDLRVIKLDEWGGVRKNSPGTCEAYLQRHLIGPLKIDDTRYISFESDPPDPSEECNRIQKALAGAGAIQICLLGLGMNGHLALNEPADFLKPSVHIAEISKSSLHHSMVEDMQTKPAYGITLGMGDILGSKLILLLISGSSKKAVASELLSGRVSTNFPASFLWLHPNVICLFDQDAYPVS